MVISLGARVPRRKKSKSGERQYGRLHIEQGVFASSPSPPQTFVELWDQIGQELARCKAQGLPPPSLYQLEIALGLDPTFDPP